jgi:hypothetical protein
MEIIGNKNEIISEVLYKCDETTIYRAEVVKYRKKRSTNANNYAWSLMEQLAIAMRTSKDEIYELMLQRYGTLLRDNDGDLIVIPTDKELKSTSKLHLKYIGKKTVNSNLLNLYAVVKGSSEYDSKEMATFIDGVVSECKDAEIETMTPEQLALLKEEW